MPKYGVLEFGSFDVIFFSRTVVADNYISVGCHEALL